MGTSESPDQTGKFPPVALIAGPTASGKTDCAVKLALALKARGTDAAVINADSAQVYRDLKQLSARPDETEMQGVEHLLFGTWDGATPCSAGNWADAARTEIDRLHAAGAVPILAGGTGLYLRTLLDGIAPVPEIHPEIRTAVRALPQDQARAALLAEDPAAAARLAPADNSRTARALEVVRCTGKPLAYWQTRLVGGVGGRISLHPCILLPDREVLNRRCDVRFERMVGGGAVTEVEALMARQLDPALPVMRAIGVREIAAYLEGRQDRDAMLRAGQLATRQYAKRQYTWFRNQPPANWSRIKFENDSIDNIFARLLS